MMCGQRGEVESAWGVRASGERGRRGGSGGDRNCSHALLCSIPNRLVMGSSRPVFAGHHAFFMGRFVVTQFFLTNTDVTMVT